MVLHAVVVIMFDGKQRNLWSAVVGVRSLSVARIRGQQSIDHAKAANTVADLGRKGANKKYLLNVMAF